MYKAQLRVQSFAESVSQSSAVAATAAGEHGGPTRPLIVGGVNVSTTTERKNEV